MCVCVQFECDLLQENVTGAFGTLAHVRADLSYVESEVCLRSEVHSLDELLQL